MATKLEVLNITAQSIIFSDVTSLNLLIEDLAQEGAMTITLEGDTATEIKGATGTIFNTILLQRLRAEIKVVKTSPKYEVYKNQLEKCALLSGGITITDDTGIDYKATRLKIDSLNPSAENGFISVTVSGDYAINRDTIL